MNEILARAQNSFSSLEQIAWDSLVESHQQLMRQVLSELDSHLKEQRDKKRYVLKGMRRRELMTRVGAVTVDRSYYWDMEASEWVFLLDEHLGLESRRRVSRLMREDAVTAAVAGQSYRSAASFIESQRTGASVSHEAIRQWTLKTSEVLAAEELHAARRMEGARQVPVLYIEADGYWPAMQKARRQELKLALVHEGWEKRSNSQEYALISRQDIVCPPNMDYWEYVSAVIESKYDLSNTLVVINGDRANWIRQGVEHFPKAIYQTDRFHLQRDLGHCLRGQPGLLAKARAAVYESKALELLETLNSALADATSKQKEQLRRLIHDIASQPNMVRDYRAWLKEEGISTSELRGMGAAEASVALFSARVRRLGRSWSKAGLLAMVRALSAHFQGRLRQAVATMERQTGLEELVKKARHSVSLEPENNWLNRRIPVLYAGRGKSHGMSHLLHQISRGTPHPRPI